LHLAEDFGANNISLRALLQDPVERQRNFRLGEGKIFTAAWG
jgi:hypothetical protein